MIVSSTGNNSLCSNRAATKWHLCDFREGGRDAGSGRQAADDKGPRYLSPLSSCQFDRGVIMSFAGEPDGLDSLVISDTSEADAGGEGTAKLK